MDFTTYTWLSSHYLVCVFISAPLSQEGTHDAHGFDPYQVCMHSIVESLSDEEDVLEVLEKLISLHFTKNVNV
ncbi:MAG: CbbQ/NirQ/NorQ domain-containing protein [Sulfuricurvum sp.]